MTLAHSYDDLSDHLAGPEPDYDTEPIPAAGLDDAQRHLERLARIERRLANDRDVAESTIAQVREWLADRVEKAERAADWHRSALVAFHEAVLDSDPSRKTISLPGGELKARAAAVEWDVTDEQALAGWAVAHEPDMLRIRTNVDRNAMKRILTVRDERDRPIAYGITVDAERPPGLEVRVPEPGSCTFSVRLTGADPEPHGEVA